MVWLLQREVKLLSPRSNSDVRTHRYKSWNISRLRSKPMSHGQWSCLPKLVREGDTMSTRSQIHQNREVQADIILPFAALDRASLPIVGGKAANLGEMLHPGCACAPASSRD